MNVLNLVDVNRSDLAYTRMVFPDGQPHLKIETSNLPLVSETILIVSRISNANDLVLVVLAKDALDYLGFERVELNITYLMAARMDRVMNEGEPFSLKSIARILNAVQFRKIKLFDPHSEVSTALIERSYAVTNEYFVQKAIQHYLEHHNTTDYWLISPDAGALKKIHKVAKFVEAPRVAECMKVRDLKTGALSGFACNQPDFEGLPCFIVDDICDGGGTFAGTAKLLKSKNAGPVVLIVSHGIFSKGDKIEGIDLAYTTNSYKELSSQNLIVFDIALFLT
jgi:ribose-phosphate pyrophosphokinase